jgi:hypothetical protein
MEGKENPSMSCIRVADLISVLRLGPETGAGCLWILQGSSVGGYRDRAKRWTDRAVRSRAGWCASVKRET